MGNMCFVLLLMPVLFFLAVMIMKGIVKRECRNTADKPSRTTKERQRIDFVAKELEASLFKKIAAPFIFFMVSIGLLLFLMR